VANQGKNTSQFSIKTSPYDSNDCLVFVYGYDTANTVGSVAQTALIPINSISFPSNTTIPDPANSTALTIQQGTLFFSNTYGYIATSNNVVKRFAISSF
jgi:hypothetical protein